MQKIFVSQDDSAVIVCPKCENRKTVPVGEYRGKKFLMKVKCKCAHIFEIELNFRKHYRKRTNFEASYQKDSLNLQGHYDNLSSSQKTTTGKINCFIKDLSATGVGLEIIGQHLIKQGNVLQITFNLDNHKQTLIQRKVTVVRISKNIVGAEFTDDAGSNPELGFYLMP